MCVYVFIYQKYQYIIKKGCENDSAFLILLIFYFFLITKS